MLGWHISVYRQQDGGGSPAGADARTGTRVAVWQSGLDGLGWIGELVSDGHVIELGGNGFPIRFTGRCEHVLPTIEKGPAGARQVWVAGKDDVIDLEKWPGRTTIDQDAVDDCKPEEWLLIEAWDES